MAWVWERPKDFGDELGDPNLRESLLLDPFFAKGYHIFCCFPKYTGQTLDPRSVLIIWDHQKLPQIFEEQSKSLRDSASCLLSHVIIRKETNIPLDWFQRHLNTLSTLGVCSFDALAPLSQFLSQQPPQSRLRHLVINTHRWDSDFDERRSALSTLVQALNSPNCKIDGFVLTHASPEECLLVAETLLQPVTPVDGRNVGCRGCRFQCLGFIGCSLPEKVIGVLAKMLQNPDSKLSELSLYGSCNLVENSESLRHLATAIQQGHCKLTRLDIRECEIDEKGLKLLFDLLKDSQMPIWDLGLTIDADEFEAISILRDALGSPHSCFQILRLRPMSSMLYRKELLVSLAEALGGQHCKVRVLDLELRYGSSYGVNEWRPFFQKIQQQQVQCLRLFDDCIMHSISELISDLTGLLNSNSCPLLWLEYKCYSIQSSSRKDTEERSLAEALQNNYRICMLSLPWRDHVAEARASSFLKRNHLYRSGGLSEQEFVNPHTAKLFICGHPEVGKTTVRKCLLKASKLCNQYLNWGSLLHLNRKKPARTRGMEFHMLSFPPRGGKQNQVVVCDLAGQQEYHAFHHYFVSGSNKDLFLVVCKFHASFLQQELESQLEYWFRFIVCHRSSGSSATKPKVIVLLNFFYDAKGMNQISHGKCNKILQKYRDELDFGLPGEENVFGIVATKPSQAIPLIDILENLLGQLLLNRATIPKICDDISSFILPKLLSKGRLFGMQYSSKTLFLPYSQLHHLYHKHFKPQPEAMPSPETFQAALLELHNAGQIVFFQPVQLGEELESDPLIITDCGWFCCDLIGSLLAPIEFRRHFNQRSADFWVWDEEDVKQMLRNRKCEEEYLDQILRYLQNLELCYPITMPQSQKQLLFPALLRIIGDFPMDDNQSGTIFLGRRLQCHDATKQLLPSGVFARLQVRLHNFCDNNSYKVWYGLIRFSKDFVRVSVRFGGDTGRWEDRQWINILISYPDNRHSWTADNIMGNIKGLIHEICQATERGCPTVVLQEYVLRDNTPDSEALPLALIQDKVLQGGIHSGVEWKDGDCAETIQFLLPSELKHHATQQLHAVADVLMEFSATDENNRGSSSHSWEEEEDVSGLDESSQKLWRLINGRFDRLEDNISRSLQDIKIEIGKLAQQLQQVENSIVSNCSTHLLTQLLDRQLPLYPYLTDPASRWKRLMSPIAGEKMQLHFMCEEGPHEIENQKGVTVVVKAAEWLVKIAPVLVPALRVFCCAARLAATVYLPGSNNVFIPSPNFLQSLGLSDEALQRQILPEALKALVGGIPNADRLINGKPLRESEVRECLSDLLQGQDVNMRKDFLLSRVVIDGKGKRTIFWVCPEHATGRHVLPEVQNPFAS